MHDEIKKLLITEKTLSEDVINQIGNIDIDEFSEIVKELGEKETQHIKSSEISKELQTAYIGKKLYVYDEVSSTNTIAKFLSMQNDENGTVIISEKQTLGKGRTGKDWESPLGGIWLSIIIKPNVDQSKFPLITLATGVAVAKALEKIGVENPEIKWPNDIMIKGKKVCGILTESVAILDKIENVIIGVGIDANLESSKFPNELQKITTTLKDELGKECDEHLLIKTFLEEFELINELFNREDYEAILKEWRKRSYSIGKTVEVRKPFDTPFDAYVIGINEEGALIVEKIDGTLEKVISGECIIKN
ncbi:MAG: biotin--[acetyl-CoA-carboxylase] ligase [Methanobrevibacter sp.]|nr:biotin--[acetyl-CoA-carboxylase] ligase [Methanobrevibacter sp.]MBE6490090.1 biotin--[acetyl-CoA-carboxylase] ligase [Methanobrevibacter sp.]